MEKVIKELTEENFGQYGIILTPKKKMLETEGNGWRCWPTIKMLETETPLAIGYVQCQTFPEIVTALECHATRNEILWSGAKDLLIVVDQGKDFPEKAAMPSADTAEVFRIKAGQAVSIKAGVWHSPAFAETGISSYYFMIEEQKNLPGQKSDPWIDFAGKASISVVR